MESNTWVRKGECSHCGWCCENIGRFEIVAPTRDKQYALIRGARETAEGMVIAGDFCAPCPQHIDNRCAIYDNRPKTCVDFPSEPNEIVNIPCSYWFEREVDGVVERRGGKESPYGT